MIKKVFLLLTAFCILNKGYAQTPDAIQSSGQPSGNSLQGSNVYSTDFYTGIASANIPIYDYSINGLDLGVSLSYNMQGIKVDDIASSVGLNWTLNSGGYITRKVVDVEDEVTLPSSGGYGSWVDQPGTVVDKPDEFTAVFGGRTINFTIEFSQSCYGCEYSVGVFPKSELYVEVLYNGSSVYNRYAVGHRVPQNIGLTETTNLITFRIIDEKGNQFFFDRGDYQIKGTVFAPYYSTSRWVLSKVITYSGQTINYNYNQFANVSYPYYQDQQVRENTDWTWTGGPTYFPGGLKIEKNAEVDWAGTLSQISKITYPNGVTVDFNISPDYSRLRRDIANTFAVDSITIESKYDSAVKNNITYRFNYAYFNTNSSTPEIAYGATGSIDEYDLRLKLKSITRAGTGHSSAEPYYSFDYNSTLLPKRLSPSRDYYGYYNGQSSVVSVSRTDGSTVTDLTPYCIDTLTGFGIPRHTFTYSTSGGSMYSYQYGTNRSFDLTSAQACMLNKITNAMGGITTFHFAGNTLSDANDLGVDLVSSAVSYFDHADWNWVYSWPTDLEGEKCSDGVHIDYVSYSDGYNHDNDYTENYTFSNGVQFFAGGYCWYPTVTNYEYYPMAESTAWYDGTYHGRIYTNSFVSAQGDINGANHGYSNLTIQKLGYAGEVLSTKKYSFTNLINWGEIQGEPNGISRIKTNWGLFSHTLPYYYMQKESMGLPLTIDEYDKDNNLLKSTTNQYGLSKYATSPSWPPYPCGSAADHGVLSYYSPSFDVPGGTGGFQFGTHTYYPFSEATTYLISSTDRIYTGGSSGTYMETPTYYAYDANDNVIGKNWFDSKGTNLTVATEYYAQPYTISYTYLTTWPTHYLQHTSAEKEYIRVGSDKYYKSYNSLSISGSLGNISFPQVGTMLVGQPNSSAVTSTTKTYAVYDHNNNVVETWYNDHRKTSSAIWDTRIEQKVADVTNAAYADIAYCSFEGSFAAHGTQDDNKGNWDFYPSFVAQGSTMTGKYYYDISGGSGSAKTVTSNNIPANGKNYIISFWCKGTPPNLQLGALTTTLTLTQQLQIGDWKLYTTTFTGDGTHTILITPPSTSIVLSYIDELRMYPSNASMTTYTYEPLFGVSSVCNERNNILYYQYDNQGRQTITKDINGNILSLTKHVVQGTDY